MPCWRGANFGSLRLLHGGGQERDVRSGTLDVPAVAGFAAAVEVASRHRVQEEQRVRELRASLISSVLAPCRRRCCTGQPDEQDRLPGIANIGFPGCSADAILMLLDSAGIDCSTGAACSAGVCTAEPRAACHGIQRERCALGACDSPLATPRPLADVGALAAALPEAVERAKAAAAFA